MAVAKQTDTELVSYNSCYFIFEKMGLTPFNGDVSKWTKDLTQGMSNFKPNFDPSEGADDHLRFVNGWKAFEAVQIRVSYQMAGKILF